MGISQPVLANSPKNSQKEDDNAEKSFPPSLDQRNNDNCNIHANRLCSSEASAPSSCFLEDNDWPRNSEADWKRLS